MRAGLRSSGATEFAVPDSVRMPLEDLRRWSRVLQAGIAAETVVFGKARVGPMTALCWDGFGDCRAMTWPPPSGSSVAPGGRLSSSCVSSGRCLTSRPVFCWRRLRVWGDERALD